MIYEHTTKFNILFQHICSKSKLGGDLTIYVPKWIKFMIVDFMLYQNFWPWKSNKKGQNTLIPAMIPAFLEELSSNHARVWLWAM